MAPPKAVSRSGSGYVLHLGRDERDVVVRLLDELRDMLQAPTTPDALARLFPVVHPDEPGRGGRVPAADARRAGHQPAGGHRHGDRAARAPGRKVQIAEAELLAFMQAVNSIRLVLGTMLDITEDDEVDPPDELADTAEYHLYGYLSWVLDSSVRAMSGDLPADLGAISAMAPSGPGRRRTSRWIETGPVLTSRCSQPDEAPLPPSSSGRGHHPFKVAARVRIPLGVRTYSLVPW